MFYEAYKKDEVKTISSCLQSDFEMLITTRVFILRSNYFVSNSHLVIRLQDVCLLKLHI